eukprot:m.168944 g.168944  ORF g.168944 m.168944 type:complete len:303 (+) comp10360_c0_seq3:1482-2390(+)
MVKVLGVALGRFAADNAPQMLLGKSEILSNDYLRHKLVAVLKQLLPGVAHVDRIRHEEKFNIAVIALEKHLGEEARLVRLVLNLVLAALVVKRLGFGVREGREYFGSRLGVDGDVVVVTCLDIEAVHGAANLGNEENALWVDVAQRLANALGEQLLHVWWEGIVARLWYRKAQRITAGLEEPRLGSLLERVERLACRLKLLVEVINALLDLFEVSQRVIDVCGHELAEFVEPCAACGMDGALVVVPHDGHASLHNLENVVQVAHDARKLVRAELAVEAVLLGALVLASQVSVRVTEYQVSVV